MIVGMPLLGLRVITLGAEGGSSPDADEDDVAGGSSGGSKSVGRRASIRKQWWQQSGHQLNRLHNVLTIQALHKLSKPNSIARLLLIIVEPGPQVDPPF